MLIKYNKISMNSLSVNKMTVLYFAFISRHKYTDLIYQVNQKLIKCDLYEDKRENLFFSNTWKKEILYITGQLN